MVPTSFEQSNLVLSKPTSMTHDECAALSVYRGEGVVISCWKLTKEELARINETGRVWLWVCGDTMPPVSLEVQHPWEGT